MTCRTRHPQLSLTIPSRLQKTANSELKQNESAKAKLLSGLESHLAKESERLAQEMALGRRAAIK